MIGTLPFPVLHELQDAQRNFDALRIFLDGAGAVAGGDGEFVWQGNALSLPVTVSHGLARQPAAAGAICVGAGYVASLEAQPSDSALVFVAFNPLLYGVPPSGTTVPFFWLAT